MIVVRTQFQLTNLLIDCLGKTQTTTSERMLLICLSKYTNPKNSWQCWPAIETLMQDSALSRSATFANLKSLKDKGILSTLPGYTGRCSHYIIHIEKITDARYATQVELDKPKEKSSNKGSKPVDKPPPAVQQSSHRHHPDCDEEEFDTPF